VKEPRREKKLIKNLYKGIKKKRERAEQQPRIFGIFCGVPG